MWDLLSCSNDSLKFIAATLSLPRLARSHSPFCAAATRNPAVSSRWKTEKKECGVHTQRPLIPLNENDSIEIGHKGSERGELASHLAHCTAARRGVDVWVPLSLFKVCKWGEPRLPNGRGDVVGKHH